MESAGTVGGALKVVVELELLLSALVSVVVVETVAVSETEAPELARATSVTVAEAPGAIWPREQATAEVPLQEPCDGAAETKLVFAGSVSATVMPAAQLDPVLVTVMV